MPRNARQTSTSGYYHVIFRGVNRQDIFLDNEDRQRFLQTLNRYRKETEVNILVFCLMDNHVHILARADSAPGSMVQKILCSYVPYFNKKYGRVGHLFSSRYYSGTLETERAVLAVALMIPPFFMNWGQGLSVSPGLSLEQLARNLIVVKKQPENMRYPTIDRTCGQQKGARSFCPC